MGVGRPERLGEENAHRARATRLLPRDRIPGTLLELEFDLEASGMPARVLEACQRRCLPNADPRTNRSATCERSRSRPASSLHSGTYVRSGPERTSRTGQSGRETFGNPRRSRSRPASALHGAGTSVRQRPLEAFPRTRVPPECRAPSCSRH
jgi:hypothetical protein